jgi:hypothetical protein
VYDDGVSPRTRLQILLEPEQVTALKRIQERTGAPLAVQIRRAVDWWIAKEGDKSERKRVVARRRP